MNKCMIERRPKSVHHAQTEEERWGAHLKQLENALKEFKESSKRNAHQNFEDDTLFPIEVSRWRVEWCKRPYQYRLDLSGITEGLPAIREVDETEEIDAGFQIEYSKRKQKVLKDTGDHTPEGFKDEIPVKVKDIENGKALGHHEGDVVQNELDTIISEIGSSDGCLPSQVYIKTGSEDHEHKKTFWTKIRNKLHRNHENT